MEDVVAKIKTLDRRVRSITVSADPTRYCLRLPYWTQIVLRVKEGRASAETHALGLSGPIAAAFSIVAFAALGFGTLFFSTSAVARVFATFSFVLLIEAGRHWVAVFETRSKCLSLLRNEAYPTTTVTR